MFALPWSSQVWIIASCEALVAAPSMSLAARELKKDAGGAVASCIEMKKTIPCPSLTVKPGLV